ncbi:MAG: HAD family phosphatase [Rhodospirillaceae bacterium]
MLLANILDVSDRTQALLWDMDGVLIDSLGLDHEICTGLLQKHCGGDRIIPATVIREGFALCPHDYWRFIIGRLGIELTPDALNSLVDDYEQERRRARFPILPGVVDILTAARAAGLKSAVVSNNAQHDVVEILTASGIAAHFDLIVGNDNGKLHKKPAPDTYLHAASTLSLDIGRCVVLEDSLVGIESGRRAGAYTVGVATGGTLLSALENSGNAHVCYQRFEERRIEIAFGDVRKKRIVTPNDFISHMVEHIAWRLGIAIELVWPNTDCVELGKGLGRRIRTFVASKRQSAALGMIDDGSAEVFIDLDASPDFIFEAIPNTDIEWFLSLRCEQIGSGQPLIDLLRGLSAGLGACIQVRVCSVEDPHHTWEGIFRSVGIALARLFMPAALMVSFEPAALPVQRAAVIGGQGRINVLDSSAYSASVVRETAESIVQVKVAMTDKPRLDCVLSVAETIDVQSFPQLLERLVIAAGLDLSVSFTATKLNSSHVVLEDVGMVLGRALLEIFQHRMEDYGVHGAGSSVKTMVQYNTGDVQVGLSIEGRKFVKFVPFAVSMQTLRRDFLIGHQVFGSTRTEDLDDFLDGLAGGLSCSIIVHLRELKSAEAGWIAVFDRLGEAIKECFEPNPYRKGVPAGVKATLI